MLVKLLDHVSMFHAIVCVRFCTWCSYKVWCSGLTSIEHQNNGTAADRRSLPSKRWRRPWNLCSTLGTARHGRSFASLDADGRRISTDLGVNSRCQVSIYNKTFCIATYDLWASMGGIGLENVGKQSRKRMKVKLYLLWFFGATMSGKTLKRAKTKEGNEWVKDTLGAHIFSDSRIGPQYP